MSASRVKKERLVPFGIGVLLLALVVISARPRVGQEPLVRKSATDKMSPSKLRVVRMKQPDSPLIISRIAVDNSDDTLAPIIRCDVRNDSAEQIAAYAVKHEAFFSQRDGSVAGSIAFNPPDRDHGMRPGDIRQVEISGLNYGETPQIITLSVDFVEFVSGTRWGQDTLKTGESLDGIRAGAQAEREILLNVLMTEGTDGLKRSLDSAKPEPDQFPTRSPEWLDGFRHGIGWIRERVRATGSNHSEIERELHRSELVTDREGKPR